MADPHPLFRGLLSGFAWIFLAFAPVCVTASAAEVVTLLTGDGVELRLTYHPSSIRRSTADAKQVTPVLMLHDHKENRSIFNSLTQKLLAVNQGKQKGPAFAVVTADLRAHGESNQQRLPTGATVTLDFNKLNKQVLAGMARFDMEALRSFLVEKNDEGELNLNKLCIVGAGMGASVAANWALHDWSAPPLAIGKQGQDVKALVLISPRWSFNGLSFQAPMRFAPLKREAAWMLMYGEQDKEVKNDIERIEKQLARFHPDQPAGGGPSTSSLQVVKVQSRLQGGTLLVRIGQPMEEQIVAFLTQQVARVRLPWSNRLARVPQN